MKVSIFVFCLALVPFALAQAPVEPEQTWFDQGMATFNNFLDQLTQGAIDRQRIREDITSTFNKGLTLIEDSINKAREAAAEYEIDVEIPETNIPPAEEILAELETGFQEFQDNARQQIDAIQARFQRLSFDSQPGPVQVEVEEPEPAVEEEQKSDFWSGWFSK